MQVCRIKIFSFTLKNYAILFSDVKRCGTQTLPTGEKWGEETLNFQGTVSELGKGHDKNQRKNLGLQKPHKPATK